MAQSFDSFKIEHVYRDQNAEADTLANEALDETSGRSAAAPRLDANSAKPQPPQPHKVRARFRNGALVPLDPLDLPEGSEVEIVVRPITKT
jgi:hypothetical protein